MLRAARLSFSCGVGMFVVLLLVKLDPTDLHV